MRRFVLMLCLSVALFVHATPPMAAQDDAPSGRPAQQTPAQIPSPDDKAQDKSSTSDKSDYSKEPFVVEQLHNSLRFENDGTGKRTLSLRVHVLSESGVREWGQLQIGYNSANEKIEIPFVRVRKQDGSVVTAAADAIQDLTSPIQRFAPVYTDYHQKHVTVPGLRPGDTIEYQVLTTVQTPLAAGQFWTQYDFQKVAIVLDEQLEIDVPAGRAIKMKTKSGVDAKITEENGRKIYRWSSSHLTRDDEKKDSEKSGQKKKKHRPEDDIPAIQLTTFSSWEELGRWYASLEKDRRAPSPAVRSKADDLTKNVSTDLDKIQALYDYTALNFRYVSLSLGAGRYQPHSAEDVLHNQYGDCKDKNTLLAALLEAKGFHSSSVLINSHRKLDPDVPSPSQFDHVITMVPLGKDEIWMDTTSEVAPFRLLSYSLRKKQALVVSQNAPAHLEETPADPPMPDTEDLTIDGKIDDSGALDIKISYLMRGDSEIVLRQVFRNNSSAQWQDVIERMSAMENLGKAVSEVTVSDPAATREPFKFSYRVVKSNYVDWSKKKQDLKLPLPVFGLANADPEDADDPEPLKLGAPNLRNYHITLEVSSKYSARAPLAISLKRDYAEYEASYKLEGNVFKAGRKLDLRQSELPSARVQDYLAFRRGVTADLVQPLSLETIGSVASTAPAGAKAEDLLKDGNAARRDGNYTLAIDLLNRAVEAAPKSRTAWDALGLAYFDSRQDGLAINAFQKQIDVNAYDQNAYNNLGRVYLRQRKYDDAIKWFNKQIEINPLDKYAHGNLGTVYLETHKYDAALPELQQAVSLTPNNAQAQVRLGNAYLNLGQDEKAMAAFDQALKISARPATWNSIAYDLAGGKVHLDIAHRYAESAVLTTSVTLRNISLEQSNRQAFDLTHELANYWDTLGWVEFADGNLDKAQKFVTAAWQLDPSATKSDHLGQIYEKKGDKQEAAHFYGLSLNARRPDPETGSRLAALVGENKINGILDKYRDEPQQQRTLKIANTAKQQGSADFLILLNVGPKSDVSIEGIKQIGSDEKFKAFADSLRSSKFSQTIPDENSVKIFRRGTLRCATPSEDCTFLLIFPEDVHTVD